MNFLRLFLTQILASNIKDKLPELRRESKEQLAYVCSQLKELDDNNFQEKRTIDAIICLAEDVITDLKNQLEGFNSGVDYKDLALGRGGPKF